MVAFVTALKGKSGLKANYPDHTRCDFDAFVPESGREFSGCPNIEGPIKFPQQPGFAHIHTVPDSQAIRCFKTNGQIGPKPSRARKKSPLLRHLGVGENRHGKANHIQHASVHPNFCDNSLKLPSIGSPPTGKHVPRNTVLLLGGRRPEHKRVSRGCTNRKRRSGARTLPQWTAATDAAEFDADQRPKPPGNMHIFGSERCGCMAQQISDRWIAPNLLGREPVADAGGGVRLLATPTVTKKPRLPRPRPLRVSGSRWTFLLAHRTMLTDEVSPTAKRFSVICITRYPMAPFLRAFQTI